MQQLFYDHRPYAICAIVTIGLRALAIHFDFKLPPSGAR